MKPLPPKTKLGRILRREIPDSFNEEVSSRIQDFSVAIARMRGNDVSTFEIIGSGTLVIRDGRYGVLTAHHCLHAWDPPVVLGNVGPYRIYLIAKNGHMPWAMQHEFSEMPLGVPKNGYGEAGPDLTFIEIPQGPVLQTLKGYASFCSLNHLPEVIARRFCVDRAYLATVGYPANLTKLRRDGQTLRVNAGLMIASGSLRERDVERSRGWDYVSTLCDYRVFPTLQKQWGGMSGGGIWAVLFTKEEERFEVQAFALVGVTFYQTRMNRGRCRLRGHFVRSIYRRGWSLRK